MFIFYTLVVIPIGKKNERKGKLKGKKMYKITLKIAKAKVLVVEYQTEEK